MNHRFEFELDLVECLAVRFALTAIHGIVHGTFENYRLQDIFKIWSVMR